jgi:hypothetical protein
MTSVGEHKHMHERTSASTPAGLEELPARGAREHEPMMERGEGFVTASVVDPFGNVLGLIHSPNYVEMLAE